MELEEQPGRQAIIDGKPYLFFSGYAYLGMHGVKAFTDLVKKGIDTYGWSFPSARISNTKLSLYTDFEDRLSQITGCTYTVSTASGYMAGRMAVQLFQHKADFFVAPGTHPAVAEGMPQYKGSFEDWTRHVLTTLNTGSNLSLPVIIADSVNPLTGEMNDLSFLAFIQKKAVCIIDDSHGIGITGSEGRGVSSIIAANDNIDFIFVYSLSKAFNLSGGAISMNSETFANKLKQLPAYAASTAISPALLHAFLNGQEFYRNQYEALKRNISDFNTLIAGKKTIQPSYGLPVFVFKQTVDENDLLIKGIIISSFAYPDPAGKKIQRIVINALHTREDLEYLAANLS